MNGQKIVVTTRYIPGGMNLGPCKNDSFLNSGALKKQPKNKEKLKALDEESHISNTSFSEEEAVTLNKRQFTNKWINETPFEEFSHQSQSTESSKLMNTTVDENISPPKTICKNRSVVLEEAELMMRNTNSVFNVDVKSIQLPSVIVKYESHNSSETVDSERKTNFKSRILQTINKHKTSIQSNNCSVNSKNINNRGDKILNSDDKASFSSFDESKESVTQCLEINEDKCDTLPNNDSWKKSNTVFNEGNDESKVKKGLPLLKTDNINKPIKLTKVINNEVIIHGTVIPKPINTLKETYFDENVLKALETIKCTSARVMQSYMWPAILRGLNVFMVGPEQCGKSLSYAPAICTFAMNISQKYPDFSVYSGPLILIICTDDRKCKEIYCLINSLMKGSWETARVEILTDMSSVEDCDVVVAVQSDLEKCLKSQMLTLKRLCHLILEDANILLRNPFMGKFLKLLNEIQGNRPHNKNIQVIATAEKWTADLESLMKKLYTTPVVCFQDFVEAALYSKVAIKKKKLSTAHKRFHLEDILKQRYSVNKSIVFCNEEDISEISEYLEMKGIECISISKDLLQDEIRENEDMWCSLTMGRFKVLLCTDELFKITERVTIANWLIHYSPPENWTAFQYRFKSLAANITCPLNVEDDDAGHVVNNCSYLMICDKKCSGNNIFNDFFTELITSQIPYLKL